MRIASSDGHHLFQPSRDLDLLPNTLHKQPTATKIRGAQEQAQTAYDQILVGVR
jgi:hypothetical protein